MSYKSRNKTDNWELRSFIEFNDRVGDFQVHGQNEQTDT